MGPPLFCSGPSTGIVTVGALPLTVQLSSLRIKLLPMDVRVPAQSLNVDTQPSARSKRVSRFPAMMVFWKLKVLSEALKTPPPIPMPVKFASARLSVIVTLNKITVPGLKFWLWL